MKIEEYRPGRIFRLSDREKNWLLVLCLILMCLMVVGYVQSARTFAELDASRIALESKVAEALAKAGVE